MRKQKSLKLNFIMNIRFRFRGFQASLLKEMWVFTFFIFINQIIDQINWSVDKFLLGRFAGTTAVAVYGVGGQINSMYIEFSSSVSNVFVPKVNRIVAESGDDRELTKLFTKVGRIQFIILGLILSGFTFFGIPFIKIWAGPEYGASYAVALLLIIPVTVPLIQNLGIEIQRAKNMHKARAVVYLAIAMPLNQKALVIVVSQSGETADTLAALRLAKEKGITTMAIVNVVGSSIAREADKVFYTLAGPEISVATTKAYSAQLAAMYCLAVQFAKVRGKITDEQYSYYISELQTLPEKMQKTLEDKERIQWFAAKYANAHDVFFVGRGIDYAVCLEGSLKLKEISYIHSEAYAAGELKHGTISLIEQGTLVIGVLTQSELYEKTVSNMVECKSRGAYLMGLTTYGKYEIEDQVNFTVYVPKVDEHFVGSLAVIPLQLLGYYVSVAKGLDVDKPRNLAKSVTVE